MIAFREALAFQDKVGRKAIEQRARDLTTQLMAGLSKMPGVKMWTSPAPELRAAVVSFLPGTLDANKLATALYEKDKIGDHDARRPGPRRPARLAALLQQPGGSRSAAGGAGRISQDGRVTPRRSAASKFTG